MKISKAAMSTPANGIIPSCSHAEAVFRLEQLEKVVCRRDRDLHSWFVGSGFPSW